MMQLFKRSQSFLLPSAVSLLLWVPGAAIALILLSALLQLRSKEMRRNVVYQIKSAGTWIGLPLLYLIYVGGMIWSENTEYGFRDLETKLGLLVFPLILLPLKPEELDSVRLKRFFSWSCFVAFFVLLLLALKRYAHTGQTSEFFYTALSSPLMHPSYLAMYVSLAIVFQIESVVFSSNASWRENLIMVFILLLFIVLLSARMAILSMLVVYPFLLLYYHDRLKGGVRVGLWLLPILMVVLARGLYSVNDRITQVSQSMQTLATASSEAHDSASGRLMIWKLGLDLVKDAPLLGYGTGDAKDVLIDSYQKAGFTYGAERKLNAHNQFLQTVLAVGIPGLLLLLWVFAEAIRNREPVFIAWMLVFSLNALTESVLETQKGVLFVSVFYALLRPSFIQPPQKRS